ncbi:Sulfite reductase [Thiomonas arsenitoxydans]|uniref:Sulfite reductase n=1 Tax=Thiomonas arsenitoxydans (strain DSM 22701 / CIP 110005 / 3As) TaxID=426114 RepID=D6CMF6_THIA3|nr:nitrite/sulfite reductase [Thiomonas arsenitoxydans]CQR44590.1 Sulfite reductase [Thiomonas sp. CB3]CAZ89734.1 Sulfite reductase [Thiomonas arsenitoxydans]CQR31522.1 Sulfite reductase [Thiomonas arsenitoxydans]CQR36217.1 Sulfite reductase [Thiomonas arsenitoxydans]CQR39321.1 Sulfite reductase [Thiomonas arsenitoxydans]
MYQYTDFDRRFIRARAAQYRDQLERHLAGSLSDEEFKPLRLQNGWYIQRHAPMLRVAIPYGALASQQLRALADIAEEYDRGYGHFTTRQNLQYNWIALADSADVMDRLAAVDMHGIQTSGNCVRNISSDVFAGIAPDEIVDPRPFCEILRQWSTLHPEFAYLPRKFKIAVSGAREDRVAAGWYDIGLQALSDEHGQIGFRVQVGGGMGRTPMIGDVIRDFLPWQQLLVYVEAILRVYNSYGRRDNIWKARIKMLVKAEGARFTAAVEREFADILQRDPGGDAHLIPLHELNRVATQFAPPHGVRPDAPDATAALATAPAHEPAYLRWLQRNVHTHRVPGLRAATLSLKRAGQAPGDVTAQQMRAAADLAERYSLGELRVSHEQNLVLPWVSAAALHALWRDARKAGFATPNIGLLTDMIACPGGDFCSLANARSIPIAAAIIERYTDLDELFDIGDIDLNISGCINSCGHHHSGHIGILGVDKDGAEWYQITVGGGDGSELGGAALPGKIIGPSFAAEEVPDVVEALIALYLRQRQPGELFVAFARRVGAQPFKAAADAVRRATATPEHPQAAAPQQSAPEGDAKTPGGRPASHERPQGQLADPPSMGVKKTWGGPAFS